MFDIKQLQANSLTLTLCGLFLVCARILLGWKRKRNLPPGPKGIPIFGNLFQLSKAKVWKVFEEWGKEYGPIVYIEIFGQGILVLNSHKVASDLFDRRGGNYNDRRFYVLNEILSHGLFLPATRYGDLWRKMRRGSHDTLNKTATRTHYRVQEREAIISTEAFLKDSKGWYEEIARGAASAILSAVYDLPPTLSGDDPLIEKIAHVAASLGHAAYPGNYLVEFFPWMKYLPSAISHWKIKTEGKFAEISAFFEGLFRDVERQIDEGADRPGMVGDLVRGRGRLGLNNTEESWLAGSIYLGGADTLTAAMAWGFLGLVAFPDKQKKCQDELDAVVGRSRMPTLEDMDNLPYMKATVREALRWRPLSPFGTHHASMEDDWYQGYLIPKGTICFPNIWSLNRDRDIYGQDADDFNPDRFINESGEVSSPLTDSKEGHAAYGFGLRKCPGRHFANNSMFINFACILWAATISPVVDETGNPVIPDLMANVGTGGSMIWPVPFEFIATPRFGEATALVAQTKEMYM